MTDPVSVLGGTGAQGGGVVDALLAARKFKVRVASRNFAQKSEIGSFQARLPVAWKHTGSGGIVK